jgi:glycosyltransferase involved in cell wall biosynthesis
MKRVLIIQEHLPHYRVPFFEGLRDRLTADGVKLEVVFHERRAARFIAGDLPWAWWVGFRRCGGLIWHRGTMRRALAADLVIASQEVKYLVPTLLLVTARIRHRRFGYWGHGRNFQATDPDCAAERVKRFLSRRVDWWFAYNELSARIVRQLGYPEQRITVVMNAVDTRAMRAGRAKLGPDDLARVRRDLGLGGNHVGLYSGALHAHKRLPFLLDCARLIRGLVPDFELLVMGTGSEEAMVRKAAREHSWIRILGPKDDREKVPYWALAKVTLMPGPVGLVVLDSFAFGVPMVTTACPGHGPEIDYLRDGVNGLMVDDWQSPLVYAEQVAALLRDDSRREAMARAAAEEGTRYTVEEMAERFAGGIRAALR